MGGLSQAWCCARARGRALLQRSPATAPRPRARRDLSVRELLGGAPDAGFERALEPRAFSFPADHGPHPDFRTEWWYFTGNLATARRARASATSSPSSAARSRPKPPERAVGLGGTRQVWMAHFAVSDARGGRFHAFERFSRGALGLAGAQAEPLRVWLEDWSGARLGEPSTFPLRLRAQRDGQSRLDLVLEPGKPLVLQGDRGLSQKGVAAGQRLVLLLAAPGCRRAARSTVGGASTRSRGSSWLDREWSTSALDDGQVGWDWFALQLDDGTRPDVLPAAPPTAAPIAASAGTLVAPDGRIPPAARRGSAPGGPRHLAQPGDRRRLPLALATGGCRRGAVDSRSSRSSPTRSCGCPSSTGRARWPLRRRASGPAGLRPRLRRAHRVRRPERLINRAELLQPEVLRPPVEDLAVTLAWDASGLRKAGHHFEGSRMFGHGPLDVDALDRPAHFSSSRVGATRGALSARPESDRHRGRAAARRKLPARFRWRLRAVPADAAAGGAASP